MNQAWYDAREMLLFKTAPGELAVACHEVQRHLAARYAQGPAAGQAETAALAADLCLDLQSYLPRWHLQRPSVPGGVADNAAESLAAAAVADGQVGRGRRYPTPAAGVGGDRQSPRAAQRNHGLSSIGVADGLLASEAAAFRALLSQWGAVAELARVQAEEALLRRSNFLRMTRLADAGRIATRWGYDYADGVAAAMRRGALLTTTNPPLVNMIRKEQPQRWEPVRAELRRAHPGCDRDRLASLFSLEVVLANCRILRPVYEASGGRYGYVNLQVNPHAAQDAGRMGADIEWLYGVLRERLGGTPNVVFKVPGTRAALETVRRVTAKGIGVTITLGFSVDQHLAFAEAIEAGNAPVSFLVMMNGRLDDPIRDELAALGVAGAADLAKWASTAVVRRSYGLVYRQGGSRRSALLIASLRGPWNVDSAITHAAAPVFITSFPDKTEEYDAEEREIVSHIDEPVCAATLASLQRSALFRQAYEPGAIGVGGFDSYHPVAITLKAFAAAWDELAAWLAG